MLKSIAMIIAIVGPLAAGIWTAGSTVASLTKMGTQTLDKLDILGEDVRDLAKRTGALEQQVAGHTATLRDIQDNARSSARALMAPKHFEGGQ